MVKRSTLIAMSLVGASTIALAVADFYDRGFQREQLETTLADYRANPQFSEDVEDELTLHRRDVGEACMLSYDPKAIDVGVAAKNYILESHGIPTTEQVWCCDGASSPDLYKTFRIEKDYCFHPGF